MIRNRECWFFGVAIVLCCFKESSAIAQTSTSGIEIARQSPVILFDQSISARLVVDQVGHLFFADHKCATLRVANSNDGKVSTLFAAKDKITDFTVDASGNVWIAILSGESGRVLKLSPSPEDYKLSRFSEPVPIDIQGLVSPTAVAIDGNGDLYVADRMRRAVLKVHPRGGVPAGRGDKSVECQSDGRGRNGYFVHSGYRT